MSNVSSILVAGATGAVGSRVAALASGRTLRTLSRHAQPGNHVVADATDPRACVGVCDGIDTVFSALGASVGLNSSESRSYHAVDTAANRNLIAEARRAGVRRFVYVSLHVSDGYAHTRYALAHEEVVATLRQFSLELSPDLQRQLVNDARRCGVAAQVAGAPIQSSSGGWMRGADRLRHQRPAAAGIVGWVSAG